MKKFETKFWKTIRSEFFDLSFLLRQKESEDLWELCLHLKINKYILDLENLGVDFINWFAPYATLLRPMPNFREAFSGVKVGCKVQKIGVGG